SRKNGFVVTVSTRALKLVIRSSLSVLRHQWHQSPAHLHELAFGLTLDNRVRRISRSCVEVWPQVRNRCRRLKAIERADCCPRIITSEASAHDRNIGDQLASLKRSPCRSKRERKTA